MSQRLSAYATQIQDKGCVGVLCRTLQLAVNDAKRDRSNFLALVDSPPRRGGRAQVGSAQAAPAPEWEQSQPGQGSLTPTRDGRLYPAAAAMSALELFELSPVLARILQ